MYNNKEPLESSRDQPLRKRKFTDDVNDEESRKRFRRDKQNFVVSSASSLIPSTTQTTDSYRTQSSTLSPGYTTHIPVKVGQIFHHLYEDVTSLYNWVTRLDIEGIHLVQEGDSREYINLLHTTLVAEVETKKVQLPTSLSQASHQEEVILRVIQRLKKKNASNVLSFGFGNISENPNAYVVAQIPNLEYRGLNSSKNSLQHKPWKTLLKRIGDELMSRLLERTSVFYSVPPSNFVQLTGVPIYELFSSVLPLPYISKKKSAKWRPDTDTGRTITGIKRKREENLKDERKTNKKTKKSPDEKEANFRPFDFNKLLPRQSILYAKCLVEQLPKTFCLQYSPIKLSRLIFEESVEIQPQQQAELKDEQRCEGDGNPSPRLVELCQKLINNHSKCRYRSLLNHYCTNRMRRGQQVRSVPVYSRGGDRVNCGQILVRRCGHKKIFGFRQLLESTVSCRQIFLFLRAVCLRVIPLEMFGDCKNQNVFFKHLKEILNLGRHEKYCLGQLMMNVKVTSYRCLHSEAGHLHRVRRVAQIHWWLFSSFIFPLIKAFFYVTETNLYRNRLLFYRKGVWLQLQNQGLKAHLQRKMLTPIPKIEVEQLLHTGQALGVCTLRFLPKLKGLRPLVNMGRKPDPWTKKDFSINTQLKTLLSILQYHVQQNPALLQSGKFGFDDIHQEYSRFVLQRKNSKDKRPLFFVKTDINKCFDNIQQDKLFNIIKDIIMSVDEYLIRRPVSVLVAGDRLKRLFHRETLTLRDFEPDFIRYIKKRAKVDDMKNRIFVDQLIRTSTTAEETLSILKSHLFNNIIQIGRRFYRQTVGISQGSILSTMLCTLYTAHMELETAPVPEEDELMMRLVDDNLYITPYKRRAVMFLEMALKGSKDYNLYSNTDKVLINFKYNNPELGPVPSVENTAPFPWCGMLLDTKDLSVSVDYSRYAGQAIRDTLTLDFAAHPGVSLKNKLLLTLRSRCHSIFVDPQINSIPARVTNIYSACLLSAHKFHTYILHVWPARKRNNQTFMKNVILILGQYLCSKQEAVMKECHDKSAIPVQLLSDPLIKWLCVQAHIQKLKQHHSMYAALLKVLKRYRKGFWRRMSLEDRLRVSSDELDIDKIYSQFKELVF